MANKNRSNIEEIVSAATGFISGTITAATIVVGILHYFAEKKRQLELQAIDDAVWAIENARSISLENLPKFLDDIATRSSSNKELLAIVAEVIFDKNPYYELNPLGFNNIFRKYKII